MTFTVYRGTSRPKENLLKIASNKQSWHGFNLYRGHIFGIYKGGYYISTGEIARFKDGHAFYQLYYERGLGPDGKPNKNVFRWFSSSISEETELGKLIKAQVNKKSFVGVDRPQMKKRDWESLMRPSTAPKSTFGVLG